MKTFDQLAQSAYAAYKKSMELADSAGRIWGQPMQSWEQLDVDQQQSWVAVAKQLLAEFAAIH